MFVIRLQVEDRAAVSEQSPFEFPIVRQHALNTVYVGRATICHWPPRDSFFYGPEFGKPDLLAIHLELLFSCTPQLFH